MYKKKQKRTKEEKTNLTFIRMERLSILFAILGLTIIQIASIVWNALPFVKIYKEEKDFEHIKILQNYDYIEQILGKPMIKKDISLPTINDQFPMTGSKIIFCSQLYTFITYFDDNEILQGYFLISNDDSFTPKMFRNEKVIGDKLSNYTDELFGGYLAVISSSYGMRRDTSNHFMKYYTHHLATNGCLIGVGISSFGFGNNDFVSLAGDEDGFIVGFPIDYNEYKERFNLINQYKINTFAMFNFNDYDLSIDIIELIREETTLMLGMTQMDYDILTE